MKNKVIIVLSFIALGFIPTLGHAQSVLEADATAFRYDSTRDQIEVYYGVLQRGLNFVQVGNAWEAPLKASIEIWQKGKAIEHRDLSQTVRYECTKEQLDSIGASKLLGVTAFTVPYADNTYAAFIWQRGSATARDTIRSERLVLPRLKSDQIEFSGIELGSNIAPVGAGATSPFEKNGYVFTPNPLSVYGENYTKLYYYTELYVPKSMVDPAQSVTITTRVLDPTGKQIIANSQKQALSATTIPIIIGFDIDGLPQDRYRLEVLAKEGEGVLAKQEKPFFFVSGMQLSEESPAHGAAPTDDELFAASPFAALSTAQSDELIEQSLYLGTQNDRKRVSKLSTVEAKNRFLFDFWRAKDAPNANPLSAFAVFQSRLREVAQKYSYQKTPGWKTGRGRVYLIYGPPVELDEHMFDPETKPYVIWWYDADQNIRLNSGTRPEFVFVDRSGGGNLALVHSNVLGEISEPDWFNQEAHRLAH